MVHVGAGDVFLAKIVVFHINCIRRSQFQFPLPSLVSITKYHYGGQIVVDKNVMIDNPSGISMNFDCPVHTFFEGVVVDSEVLAIVG